MKVKSLKFKYCLSRSSTFQLNILHVRSHVLKEILKSHVKNFEMEKSWSFTLKKKKKNASYYASINLYRLFTSNTNHKISAIYYEKQHKLLPFVQ
jgi:hypothetical protein